MNAVSVAACTTYEEKTVRAAVSQHFATLDAASLVRSGMRVTIKPNLLMKRRPEEGTTTHPALVKAVVLELQSLGVTDITIADSPGGPYTKSALEGIYKASGMAAVANETGASLNFDLGWQAVHGAQEHSLCREWNIINPVAGADLVINLPKLKTHAMMVLSGGVKNLFGCIPGLQKPELHFRFPEKERFGEMLMELGRLIQPALTIVDAVVSMEGDGPSAGGLKETGMTFGSRDIFCLDRALCDYVGLDPGLVPMVWPAVEAGLCPRDSQELEYLGEGRPKPADHYKMPSSKPLDFTARLPGPLKKPVGRLLAKAMAPRPVIHRARCIGCGKCAESCAPDAASVRENRKAYIDYRKCIACYCCHEMCPVKAIGIRRSPLRF